MAFVVRDGNEKLFNETKLYTGISKMYLKAICPNLKELQDLGFGFKEEPVYTSIGDGGAEKVRIDMVFQNSEVKTKTAFFLENKDRVDSKGIKYQWIDKYGNNTWAPTKEQALENTFNSGKKCVKDEGLHIAKVGEVAFIEFMRDWAAFNPETDEITFDLAQLFKGNFKELQDIFKHPNAKTNQIYTLSTVKDGKYQQVYAGFFVRMQFGLPTALTKFKGHIEKQKKDGYPIKVDYTLNFVEYTPSLVSPDPEPHTGTTDQPDF